MFELKKIILAQKGRLVFFSKSIWENSIQNFIPIIIFFTRVIIYETIILLSFQELYFRTDPYLIETTEILGMLVSVISIIVAIIVTYLFSKLFSEKAIKIERKKDIDRLSLKITWLRQIAFHIRNMHEFWRFGEHNIKSRIDHRFPNLTYEEYRSSVVGGYRLSYEEILRLDEVIYGNSGQAYLAIKGLIDDENDFEMYGEFKPRNYTLNDILRYQEYAGSFWYLLDRSDNEVVNFNGIHQHWLTPVDERYFRITGKIIDADDRKREIQNLLSDFESIYFRKHFYLTKLNSKVFSPFLNSFSNLFFFIIILLCSMTVYTIKFSMIMEHLYTIILLVMFIGNTIDLVFITINSIYKEQNVSDIFIT